VNASRAHDHGVLARESGVNSVMCGMAEAAIAAISGVLHTGSVENAQEVLARFRKAASLIRRIEAADIESSRGVCATGRTENAQAVFDSSWGFKRRRSAADAIELSRGLLPSDRAAKAHAVFDRPCAVNSGRRGSASEAIAVNRGA